MASANMNQALLKALSRSQLQQLAKREGIKANSKSASIIQELLKKYPSGVPRESTSGVSENPAPITEVQVKVKVKGATKTLPVIVAKEESQPPSKRTRKRRKLDTEDPVDRAESQPSKMQTAQAIQLAERLTIWIPPALSSTPPGAQTQQPASPVSQLPHPVTPATPNRPVYHSPSHTSSPNRLVPGRKEVRLVRRQLTEITNGWSEIAQKISETQLVVDQVKKTAAEISEGFKEMYHNVSLLEDTVSLFKDSQRLWDGSWKLHREDRRKWRKWVKVTENLKHDAVNQKNVSEMIEHIRVVQKTRPHFWMDQIIEDDNDSTDGEEVEGCFAIEEIANSSTPAGDRGMKRRRGDGYDSGDDP